jgi:hypothetical protein
MLTSFICIYQNRNRKPTFTVEKFPEQLQPFNYKSYIEDDLIEGKIVGSGYDREDLMALWKGGIREIYVAKKISRRRVEIWSIETGIPLETFKRVKFYRS